MDADAEWRLFPDKNRCHDLNLSLLLMAGKGCVVFLKSFALGTNQVTRRKFLLPFVFSYSWFLGVRARVEEELSSIDFFSRKEQTTHTVFLHFCHSEIFSFLSRKLGHHWALERKIFFSFAQKAKASWSHPRLQLRLIPSLQYDFLRATASKARHSCCYVCRKATQPSFSLALSPTPPLSSSQQKRAEQCLSYWQKWRRSFSCWLCTSTAASSLSLLQASTAAAVCPLLLVQNLSVRAKIERRGEGERSAPSYTQTFRRRAEEEEKPGKMWGGRGRKVVASKIVPPSLPYTRRPVLFHLPPPFKKTQV